MTPGIYILIGIVYVLIDLAMTASVMKDKKMSNRDRAIIALSAIVCLILWPLFIVRMVTQIIIAAIAIFCMFLFD